MGIGKTAGLWASALLALMAETVRAEPPPAAPAQQPNLQLPEAPKPPTSSGGSSGSPEPPPDSDVPADQPSQLVPNGGAGYWWYRQKPKPPEDEPDEKKTEPPVPTQKPEAKLKDCQDEKQWTPDCGFIVPKTFAFQEKMRDSLFQGMVMDPGNPQKVRWVQEYTKWVLHQAEYAAAVWQHNTLNDTSLDAQAKNPISAYGLQMAMTLGASTRQLVWDTISSFGGILILFTREDCDYCHAQVTPLQRLLWDTHLELWDASIGGNCLTEFKDKCVGVDKSTTPASILNVSVVPTLYLYLPGNVWIRVSNGLTDAGAIEDRIYNLFIEWRTAAVDKTRETGNTGLALDPKDQPTDTDDLRKLLMAPIQQSGG